VEGEEYSRKFNICTLRGKKNIIEYMRSTYNCAYGQMGNMGIGIYANKDRDHVILTHCCIESDAHTDWLSENGFEEIGEVSCRVWRFEATDKNTLYKFGYDVDNEIDDTVIVPIKSGKWKMNHYYTVTKCPEPVEGLKIYSEFKLKK